MGNLQKKPLECTVKKTPIHQLQKRNSCKIVVVYYLEFMTLVFLHFCSTKNNSTHLFEPPFRTCGLSFEYGYPPPLPFPHCSSINKTIKRCQSMTFLWIIIHRYCIYYECFITKLTTPSFYHKSLINFATLLTIYC